MTTINTMATAAKSSINEQANLAIEGNSDMFMKLFLAQMTNQTPDNMADMTDFTSQLSQLAQVQEATKTNKNLEALNALISQSVTMTATSFIGKEVNIALPTSILGADGAKWDYTLNTNADTTKLQILDSRGTVVRELDGNEAAGDHELIWDGKDAAGKDLPPGMYTLKITASTAGGLPVQSWSSGRGVVESVHFENGNAYLDLGGGSVELGDIITIRGDRAAAA